MKNSRLKMFVAALICVFMTAGTGITAQAQTQAKPKERGVYSKEYRNDEDMATRWSEKIQRRMTSLHGKLNLAPAQEQAWRDYQEVIISSINKPKLRDRTELAAMSAPERLEKLHAKAKEREAVTARLLDATKTFYAQLTPEQQKTFDAETPMGRGEKPTRSKKRRK